MNTNSELDGKYLGTITKDFVKIAYRLKEAAYELKARGISNYPIFPIAKEPIKIGLTLLKNTEMYLTWNYNISYLDEFIERGLIDSEKLSYFTVNYKDIEEFCCLFVVDKDFINFVYIPYPEEED